MPLPPSGRPLPAAWSRRCSALSGYAEKQKCVDFQEGKESYYLLALFVGQFDYGSVNFYSLPYPHYVFVNPKAKKKEIKCYLSDIKLVANALATAQSVSKNYIAQRDGEESKGNNQTPEKFEAWFILKVWFVG